MTWGYKRKAPGGRSGNGTSFEGCPEEGEGIFQNKYW